MAINHPGKCPPAHCPLISSEWRPLFRPEKTGCYVNDHTLIQSATGEWHVFGITARPEAMGPDNERYFCHGSGASLWSETLFTEHSAVCNNGVRAWAPGAIRQGDRIYLFYGPSPTKLSVSREYHHWIDEAVTLTGAPPEACHRDHMVMALDDTTWLMYATGLDAEGQGAISVFVSHDLRNWSFVCFALRTTGKDALTPAWGATESPYVLFYRGWYYLSVTYTDCRPENYQETLIFRSLSPFDFGTYDSDNPDDSVIQRLAVHAPEYVYDAAEQSWFITTCGWRGFGIPHEGAVSIAKLDWIAD